MGGRRPQSDQRTAAGLQPAFTLRAISTLRLPCLDPSSPRASTLVPYGSSTRHSFQYGLLTNAGSRSCDNLLQKAFTVLLEGGVVILPTTVGYTLATTRKGVGAMKTMKGRPDGKPCGILGTSAIFAALTGTVLHPPVPADLCLAVLAKPAESLPPGVIPGECIARDGRIGIWLNLGPIHARLAGHLWRDYGELVIGSSCNRAGEGNPVGACYSIASIHPDLRSAAHFVLTAPHWLEPECDAQGRWLSAPILDLQTGGFQRQGRMQTAAEAYRSAWQSSG